MSMRVSCFKCDVLNRNTLSMTFSRTYTFIIQYEYVDHGFASGLPHPSKVHNPYDLESLHIKACRVCKLCNNCNLIEDELNC